MEGRAPASLGDRGMFVRRRGAPPSTAKPPSQIILDNIVVLDKESATFDAFLASPGKSPSAIDYQLLTLSHE
jgi:hypothetical protein